MTRITTNIINSNLVRDIQDASARLSRTQEILTSGRILNRPSDDPARTTIAMTYRTEVANSDQYSRNIDMATSWANATDTVMGNTTAMIQRVRELVLSGVSDTVDSTSRADIAAEIVQLTEEIKTQANTKLAGVYIFAGTDNLTPPYTMGGPDNYNGNNGKINREIAPGITVPVNTPGQGFFGDNAGGLLLHLRDIATHLQSGLAVDLNTLRTVDLNAITSDLDAINFNRAQVGGLQTRLDLAGARLAEFHDSNVGLLADTEEADLPSTYITYNQQKTALQAAMQTGANMVQMSLMDFLK